MRIQEAKDVRKYEIENGMPLKGWQDQNTLVLYMLNINNLALNSFFVCHLNNVVWIDVYYSSGSRGGGFRGFKPPPSDVFFFFFACQYMKIPTDLDPKPPLRRILAQNPPFKEFLDPPLYYYYSEKGTRGHPIKNILGVQMAGCSEGYQNDMLFAGSGKLSSIRRPARFMAGPYYWEAPPGDAWLV